jgi:CubicO group peptidase (beta-lactamase class C family)
MGSLPETVDALAGEHDFSGVVSVDRGGDVEFVRACGLAHRAHQIPNTPDTRFAIASGAKGLTALAVVSLVERDLLDPSTTARSLLGDDLPLIDDAVTVEQLLAHRSGIGDYLGRGVGPRRRRLSAAGADAGSREHRAIPGRPRRVPRQVPAR